MKRIWNFIENTDAKILIELHNNILSNFLIHYFALLLFYLYRVVCYELSRRARQDANCWDLRGLLSGVNT